MLQFFAVNTSITVFISKLATDYTINIKMTADIQQCHGFEAYNKNTGFHSAQLGFVLRQSIKFKETTEQHK